VISTLSELIGLGGASLAGYAYLPQISHLIRERCSAGISRRAFILWFLASILITIHAVFISAIVFILLGVIQIGATSTIVVYSARYKGLVCPIHAAGALPAPGDKLPAGTRSGLSTSQSASATRWSPRRKKRALGDAYERRAR
jgi:uncharacterized protein with PQ loop repeat